MPEFDSTIRYADVPGFPGYKAGTDGSVWSCRHRGRILGYWHQLRPDKIRRGYLRVMLYLGDRKWIRRMVHHLVLEAFVGPCPSGMECRHTIDPTTSNNHLWNLAWGTKHDNMNDCRRHGTLHCGEQIQQSKLTAAKVQEIRDMKRKGITQTRIATRFNISQATVSAIVLRKWWKHID